MTCWLKKSLIYLSLLDMITGVNRCSIIIDQYVVIDITLKPWCHEELVLNEMIISCLLQKCTV